MSPGAQSRVRSLVDRPQDWPWSILLAHLRGRDDGLVRVTPLVEHLGRIDALIDIEAGADAVARLRAAESTGRRLGSRHSSPTSKRAWVPHCSGRSRAGSPQLIQVNSALCKLSP